MIYFSHNYKFAKELKKHSIKQKFPFDVMMDWFTQKYGIKPLCVFYTDDTETVGKATLIFENDEDYLRIIRRPPEIIRKIEDDVSNKYKSLMIEMHGIDPQRIFHKFSLGSFERGARREAVDKITKEEFANLAKKHENKDIWLFHGQHAEITVFLYTEEQKSKYGQKEQKFYQELIYKEILHKYDEFGYFKNRPVDLIFESKETFDKGFQGNWFFYWKK